MAEPTSESRTEEPEGPPEGLTEPELTELEHEQSEVPAEADALSRMETADELVALAEDEKVDEVAQDIVADAAALGQPEDTTTTIATEGEPAASASEEQISGEEKPEEPPVETSAEGAAPAEGEDVAKTEEEPKPEQTEGAAPEHSEIKEGVEEGEVPAEAVVTEQPPPDITVEPTVEQLPADEEATSPAKVERKVSRARFEPMRSAIEEEDDDVAANLEIKRRMEMEAYGRQSGLTDQGEFTAVSDDEIEEEALPKFSRQQMIESIQHQMAERDQLKLKNQNMQHKLALYFQNKRAEDRTGGMETAGEGEQKYASLLAKYADLVREKRILDDRSREQLDGLRERREQLRNDGEALLSQLRELKKSTVLSSVSVKTGKAPQWDDVEPQFSLEAKKDADIHKLLIENIILRNRIHKIEDTMKAKDKLGEGLHMIDFEQLKIENQTYNEKIEERNEDISKLRKKITTSVEVLTHVKEKLEYLRHENEIQKQKLEEVDKTLGVKRSKVSRLKHSRDSLRNDNEKLRHSAGLLGKNELLRDFENKVDEAEMLRRRLADLQVTHAEVNMANMALAKKINGLKASNPALQTGTVDSKSAFNRK